MRVKSKMKKSFSGLILGLQFLACHASELELSQQPQAENLQTLSFAGEESTLSLSVQDCTYFLCFDHLLDDLGHANGQEPLTVSHCSKDTFELLLAYSKTEPSERPGYLDALKYEQKKLMLEAANFLHLCNTTKQYIDLLVYALTTFTIEQLTECIEHLDRETAQNAVKQLHILTVITNELQKSSLSDPDFLGKEKMALLEKHGLLNFELSIRDLYEHEKIKELFLRPADGIRYTLNLSNCRLTSLEGLDEISGIDNYLVFNFSHNKIRKINLTVFKKFPFLMRLILEDNALTELHFSADTSLPKLGFLNLKKNKLTKIDASLLSHVPNLREVTFAYNQIATLEPDLLSGVPNLKSLTLNYNMIKTIPSSFFAHVPALKRLVFTHNQLTEISPATFTFLPDLEDLVLVHNKITKISPSAFGSFDKFKMFGIAFNPLVTIKFKQPFSWKLVVQNTVLASIAGLMMVRFGAVSLTYSTAGLTVAGSAVAATALQKYQSDTPHSIDQLKFFHNKLPRTCKVLAKKPQKKSVSPVN